MHDEPLAEAPPTNPHRRTAPAEVALLFLRVGLTAFGGPAAHIAMMKDEVVRRRGWLSSERFLDPVAGVAFAAGVDPLEVLLGGGVASILAQRATDPSRDASALLPAVFANATAATALITPSLAALFFLKVGALVFGSGYVLLAFLQADLVERLHWLTPAQLLDAVAVGQVTPGPVFTTATFIGYVLAGGWGAGLATVVDAATALLALGSAVVLLRFRVNATWLVAGGAAIGAASKAVW